MEIRYNLPPAFLQVYKHDLERVVEHLVKEGHNRIQVPIRSRLSDVTDRVEDIRPFEMKRVNLRTDLTKYRYISAILVVSADSESDREIIEAEARAIEKEGHRHLRHLAW